MILSNEKVAAILDKVAKEVMAEFKVEVLQLASKKAGYINTRHTGNPYLDKQPENAWDEAEKLRKIANSPSALQELRTKCLVKRKQAIMYWGQFSTDAAERTRNTSLTAYI